MSLFSRFASTWSGLLRRGRLEHDMDNELRFHMSAYIADQVRNGVAMDEAERRARIEFGAVESYKEECREARGLRLFDELRQDLRYACRMLWKNPAFTIVATLTLAFGIGANTSIFSVVNTWVLKPLPYPGADRLVEILSVNNKQRFSSNVTPGDLNDFGKPNQFFDGMAGLRGASFTLSGPNEPERIDGARVDSGFFRLLGVAPRIGRDFATRDDQPGAGGVAIISDDLWRTYFGAEQSVLGRVIQLDGEPVTVVGILPPDFLFPLTGRVGIWKPLALTAGERQSRTGARVRALGRVKAGVSLASATAFLAASARQLGRSYPATNADRGVRIRTVLEEIAEQSEQDSVLILFGIVGCVLLIACTNVANLMFGRATGRQKEMAVRLAIGAGRLRLMRQLLTENILLFLLGAALGLAIAVWGVTWIGNAIPASLRSFVPNGAVLKVDLPVLLYTFAIAIVTGLVIGMAPALNCLRVTVSHGLKDASRTSAGSGSTRLKKALVVFELSLALIVLVASGLLAKSMVRMYSVDPGFQTKNLVTAKITLSASKYAGGRAEAFYRDVLERIRMLPRVRSAGASQFIPFCNFNSTASYFIEGRPAPPAGEVPTTEFTAATPEYLAALGVPLIRGRFVSEYDRADSMPVVIINRTLAEREWPGQDPLGRRLRIAGWPKVLTIVGVAGDVKLDSLRDPPEPQVYFSSRQLPALAMYLVIRTEGDSPGISADIRNAVAAVDQSQPLYDWQSMEERIAVRHVANVIVMQMMTFFALLALFLAAIGIYGVISYSVSTRRREIGVRMALGARTRDVLSLVLSQGLRLTILGLAVGLAGAVAATRLLASLLFQVSPRDLATFAAVTAVLGVVALIACYVPARRAAGVDPAITLRYE